MAAAVWKYAPEVGRILGGIAPIKQPGRFARRLWSAFGRCTVLGSTTDTGQQPAIIRSAAADSARRPAGGLIGGGTFGRHLIFEVGRLQSKPATYNTGLLLMLGVLLAVATIALVSYRLFVRRMRLPILPQMWLRRLY
nr:hypothetical protein [Haliscomenobacter sp.]